VTGPAPDAPENRALTVRNPWAWAIIHGGKDVENRSQPTKHRGRLYIHAGKAWDDTAIYKIGNILPDLPESINEDLAGMVIGTVDVIGSHPATDCFKFGEPACSPWAFREPDVHHWVLANARPLATPFPARGQLGIWRLG
jgi:hypothetical protein